MVKTHIGLKKLHLKKQLSFYVSLLLKIHKIVGTLTDFIYFLSLSL